MPSTLHLTAYAHDLVGWLRNKLELEQLETDGDYSAAELAYRRAWNARGVALLADIALYVGLAELAACDVGMSGIIDGFDLSDVEYA